jgi:thiol peroxidase
MEELSGAVTFKGNPLTLMGDHVQVGDQAPDFTAVKTDMSECKLSELKGKTVILSSVPSLDTPVCDIETRTFNEKTAALEDTVCLTVSMDLPMAQKRWCGTHGIENVVTVSDYKGDHDFARKYGLLIKELGLLARCVLVIDRQGKVVHKQLVKEVAEEPDYEAALQAAKDA